MKYVMVHIQMQRITLFSSGINCSMAFCNNASSLNNSPIIGIVALWRYSSCIHAKSSVVTSQDIYLPRCKFQVDVVVFMPLWR